MAKNESEIIPIERVENRILLLRGQKVIIDSDLAALYGVSTKRLNEQVKRNKKRFPQDFMFQLTKAEKEKVVANCDHLRIKNHTTSELPFLLLLVVRKRFSFSSFLQNYAV